MRMKIITMKGIKCQGNCKVVGADGGLVPGEIKEIKWVNYALLDYKCSLLSLGDYPTSARHRVEMPYCASI